MSGLLQVLGLGLVLLLASAVPFIPTGELVSGAAALDAPSLPLAGATFAAAWIGSCVGDTLLLSEARLLARPLQRRRDQRPANAKVRRAEAWLHRNPFTAIVTARLVPGMRAPVIVALGLSGFGRRPFIRADFVGCGLWAGLYTAAGTIGGRLTSHPLVAVVLAVLIAVTASSIGGLIVRRRQAHQPAEEPTPSDEGTSARSVTDASNGTC